jgi:hypothetical protein
MSQRGSIFILLAIKMGLLSPNLTWSDNCKYYGNLCEILGIHCGEYEDESFLGYSAVYSPCCLHHRGEAVHTSQTSVYFKETAWHCIPEGCLFIPATCLKARYALPVFCVTVDFNLVVTENVADSQKHINVSKFCIAILAALE